jgi:CheY-like chemotaxis protein
MAVSPIPTVLHVDDDPVVIDALRHRVRETAVRWLTATEPSVGLSVLADRDVDCLVSNSIRTIRNDPFAVRVADRYPDLPIVLFTAADVETLDTDLRDVVDHYVGKGMDGQLEALFSRVVSDLDVGVSDLAMTSRPAAHEDEAPATRRPDAGAPGDAWLQIGTYDWADDETELATAIVTALESRIDEDAVTMPPLYERLDPEVLSALLDRSRGATPSDVRVEFRFVDRALAVTSGGDIFLRSDAG